MQRAARFYTAAELARRGVDDLPDELVSSRHLIYSSPATLAFNSPGAEGFGVKRAGLAIPGSIMLVVAPGCCGRNTSLISAIPGYEGRFFYLTLDETDIVTGRHLRKIPQAVEEVVAGLATPPSVVMICITCVDALLGTDMERVCRKAQERVGLPVRPCYMYALTREGRRPPMVHVRQSLYALLEPLPKRATSVNLLGFFAPLADDCELYRYLRDLGVRHVREVSRSASFDEFLQMAEANFNLVLHPEARFAAADLQERLGIPSIELTRLYQIDRIHRQYQALGQVLGATFDDAADRASAQAAVDAFAAAHPQASFAVGECLNGDAFELALALVRYGFVVREVFGTPQAENFVFLKRLAELSPDTRIYANTEPTMIHYDAAACLVDVALGKDASWYHPEAAHLSWNSDVQPYGYEGVRALFETLLRAMAPERDATAVSRADGHRPSPARLVAPLDPANPSQVRGLRRHLTPFAPDQSGAVAVLYGLGGLIVVCDAGGCTGNICGFDEPRWITDANRNAPSAIFSAGLRDMDAIMGRDDKLVDEVADAVTKMDVAFVAIVGTPVPAVIGTDYRALRRMVERRCGIPTITVDASGTRLYDTGAQKAYLALFDRFATQKLPVEKGRVGVLGANPLDVDLTSAHKVLAGQDVQVVCYGLDSTLDDVAKASSAEYNLVVAPSGLAAARLLRERFGTPYVLGGACLPDLPQDLDATGANVLVVGQQVAAEAVREELEASFGAQVTIASWFMQVEDPQWEGRSCIALSEEADLARLVAENHFDLVIADESQRAMLADYAGRWVDWPQFAVSGRLADGTAVAAGPTRTQSASPTEERAQ